MHPYVDSCETRTPWHVQDESAETIQRTIHLTSPNKTGKHSIQINIETKPEKHQDKRKQKRQSMLYGRDFPISGTRVPINKNFIRSMIPQIAFSFTLAVLVPSIEVQAN